MGSPKPYSDIIAYDEIIHGGNGLSELETPHSSAKSIIEHRLGAVYMLI
jgi:hypothetical protein